MPKCSNFYSLLPREISIDVVMVVSQKSLYIFSTDTLKKICLDL